jgi:WD40 repeat protein
MTIPMNLTTTTNKPSFRFSHAITGHMGPIYAMVSDHNFVYTASSDRFVTRWDPHTGQQDAFAVQTPAAAFSLAIVPTKNHLILGLDNGKMHVIDLEIRQEINHLNRHNAAVFSILANPTNGHLYSVDAAGMLCVWDSNYQQLLQFPICDSKIRQVALAPDAKSLYLACGDGHLRAFDTEYFNPILDFQAHINACTALALDFQGWLLTGGKDGYIRLWDLQGAKKASVPAHKGNIYQLVKLSDTCFASCSTDKSVKIWSLDSLTVLQKLEATRHADRRSINALIQTDTYLMAAGDNKQILCYL